MKIVKFFEDILWYNKFTFIDICKHQMNQVAYNCRGLYPEVDCSRLMKMINNWTIYFNYSVLVNG